MAQSKPKVEQPEVDPRTAKMPAAALFCRSFGHTLMMKPVDRKRAREMFLAGYKEIVLVCGNGCGWTRTIVLNIRDGSVVEDGTDYRDKSYHVPKGSGRMPRTNARLAWLMMQEPQAYSRRRPVTRS